MKPGADDPQPSEERDEGWDETVIVWNATVARIPPPGVQAGSARDLERDGPARGRPVAPRIRDA